MLKRSEIIWEIFNLVRTTALKTIEDDKICAEKIVSKMEELGILNEWEPENKRSRRIGKWKEK